MGYHRAGFEVVGVDINPQPDYPFEFWKEDALDLLDDIVGALEIDPWNMPHGFHAVHASPPCQANSRAKHLREAQGGKVKEHGADLLDPVRSRLRLLGVPYALENVPGAAMYGVTLCGSQFGLHCDKGPLRRHRMFESNVYVPPLVCDHSRAAGRPVGVYHVMGDSIPKGGRTAESVAEAQELLGIDWTDKWDSLKEAIPPAYTEYVGQFLKEALLA